MFNTPETIEGGLLKSRREETRAARIQFILGLIAGAALGIVFMLAITAAAEHFIELGGAK